jgi:hypothetical protein
MIRARSHIFDLTPGCDGFLTASGGNGGDFCGPSSPDDDSSANFSFPNQDVITRRRFFGGMKLKFAAVFVAGQYEYLPAGLTRDESAPSFGARDVSEKQTRVSLSGGFDF